MPSWIKLLSFIADIVSNLTDWFKKRKRINEVDKNSKAVDIGDDKQLASELRSLADKIDARNKSN